MTKEDRAELDRLEEIKNKASDEVRRLEMLLEKCRRIYQDDYRRYITFRDLVYENPNVLE